MATNVDRALYIAPQGIDVSDPGEGVEVEIEVQVDGDVDVDIGEGSSAEIDLHDLIDIPFGANLAEFIPDEELNALASELLNDIENDLMSRRDWEQAVTDGMKYLGIKPDPVNSPWEGASNVVHPLIVEAVVRFQSESITETFPASGPVKTKIIGVEDEEKTKAAKRVQEDMNYQITEVMSEYRGEHERMLWSLPIMGSAFKKVYFDPNLQRQVSIFVPAEDVILPYGVSDITLSPRITHRMRKTRNELAKLQYSGFYSDVELPEPTGEQPTEIQESQDREMGFSASFDDRYVLYEVQTELDLWGFEHVDEEGHPTGIALPYVVTIEAQSATVLSIRRNYVEPEEGSHTQYVEKRNHFVHYQYIPGFGAYGMGLLHLVGNSAAAATSLQRQLIDAGTLSNLPGGLKTRGLRIKGDDTPIGPGEWRDVDVPGSTLRESIMPLPYKEPSQTLLAMMGVITQDAQRLSSTADLKISDMSAQAPVGTTLAIIERSLKILSAVQARMHYSMKQELKLLAGIIRDHMDPDYDYDAVGTRDGRPMARREDFSKVEIIPVSDPNASTMAQRVVQYQAVLQLAESAPQLYDMPMLHRQMLEVLGVKNAEKLVKLDEDMKPTDPVSENMNVMMGKPIKAFLYQDHEAHIQVHMAALNDPHIMQALGQNPAAQSMLATLHAHIAEHVAYEYRRQIEQQMGAAMPHPDEELPPHIEAQLSRTSSEAANKLLNKHTAEQQAAANEAAANDPVIQLQQRETAIKEGELEVRRMKLAAEAAEAADKIALQRELEALKLELEAFKAAGKMALDERKLEADLEKEGLRMGVDIAKKQAELTADMEKTGINLGVDVAKTQIAAQQAAQERDAPLPEQPPVTPPSPTTGGE